MATGVRGCRPVASDDSDTARTVVQIEEAIGRDAQLGAGYVQHHGSTAGGDDQVIGGICFASDLDGVLVDETGEPAYFVYV